MSAHDRHDHHHDDGVAATATAADDDYAKFRDEYIRCRVVEHLQRVAGNARRDHSDDASATAARAPPHGDGPVTAPLSEPPADAQARLLARWQRDVEVLQAAQHAHMRAHDRARHVQHEQQQQQPLVAVQAVREAATLRARLARRAGAWAPVLLRWLLAQWPFALLVAFEVTMFGVSRRAVVLDLVLAVVFVCVRVAWNVVRIDVAPAAGTDDADSRQHNDHRAGPADPVAPVVPTLLGTYFARDAATTTTAAAATSATATAAVADGEATAPLPWRRRLCYVVLKCAETFVLSFSPFYSIERLEMELQRDGVVRERVAAHPVAAAAAHAHLD